MIYFYDTPLLFLPEHYYFITSLFPVLFAIRVLVIFFFLFPLSHCLWLVKRLLKVNPNVARGPEFGLYKVKLLHILAGQPTDKVSPHAIIEVIQQVVSIHPDAVEVIDDQGLSPLLYTAQSGAVEVLEFLYGFTASVVNIQWPFFYAVHIAIGDTVNTTPVMEAKVRFLFSKDPSLMLMRYGGSSVLHTAIKLQDMRALKILLEIGDRELVRELIRAPIAHPTLDDDLSLPVVQKCNVHLWDTSIN